MARFYHRGAIMPNHQQGLNQPKRGFSQMAEFDFRSIKGIVSDMDGVLWLGDEPLPGLSDLFAFSTEQGIPLILATNNSSKTRADYVRKLAKMDILGVVPEQILTSGTVTITYMLSHYPTGARVNMIGGAGLRQMLESAGYVLVDKDAQVVVVGLDVELTYDKLRIATLCLRAGADFIGTNDDPALPVPEGMVPGAGSILAALRTAAHREPLVIGKPHRPMFEDALRFLDTRPHETLMIGDRLTTDIAGGNAAGLRTALVLSGVTDSDDMDDGDATAPDVIFRDLAHLIAAWRAALA